MKLDAKSADAYAIRAEIRIDYDWDWDGAAADVRTSQELGGGDLTDFAAARVAYALGDMPQARRLLESIIARNPFESSAQYDMGFFVDFRSGLYSEAEFFIQRALDITPQIGTGHFSLGLALLMQGKLDEALASMKRETLDDGQLEGVALVYYAMGRKAESDAALKVAIDRDWKAFPSDIARVRAFRGELEQAMDCLEKAYDIHDLDLWYIKGDPLLKKLEIYPRYKAFLRKMKLPE